MQSNIARPARLARAALAIAALVAVGAAPVRAEDPPSFTLTLKGHAFSPAELKVPADKRIKLVIVNQDPTPAEFESHDFGAEKVIAPGRSARVFVGPLKPGRYTFFDEFHEKTTRGVLVAE